MKLNVEAERDIISESDGKVEDCFQLRNSGAYR